MKVKDLLAQLYQLNPELDVLVYSEDTAILGENALFRVLAIEAVDTGIAVKERGPMREPTLRFERTPEAQEIALLHAVTDF